MSINLKILNGVRKNQQFALGVVEQQAYDTPYLLEDEAIELNYTSGIELPGLFLVVLDNFIDYTSCHKTEAGFIYTWRPKPLNSWSFESLFHNYYGLAHLQLGHQTGENLEIIRSFQPIDILAKKINADRVASMLAFLARENEEALLALFRVTRLRSGLKEGGRSETFIVDQLEQTVDLLTAELNKIFCSPISKLVSYRSVVTPPYQGVDESTVAWIAENPDILQETDDTNSAILKMDDSYYSAHLIQEQRIGTVLDVYENQVIHGFLAALIRVSTELIAGFEVPSNSRGNDHQNIGYTSFFSQISRFTKELNKKKISRLKTLRTRISNLQQSAQSLIPVTRAISGTPVFTPKARDSISYRRLFSKIIAWHNLGAPDWSAQEELHSIQSIPKLFELYVLFLLKKQLSDQYHVASNLAGNQGELSIHTYGDLTITLLYEPVAWTPNHPQSTNDFLTNTEGWNVSERFSISQRGSSSSRSNRRPDYVIKLEDSSGAKRYIILDAKYTTQNKAFSHYLPSLTMKYIHGLHDHSNGENSTLGLIIVTPNDQADSIHFHHRDFTIYGSRPALPALIVSSVDPHEKLDKTVKLTDNVMKLINIGLADLQKTRISKNHHKRSFNHEDQLSMSI